MQNNSQPQSKVVLREYPNLTFFEQSQSIPCQTQSHEVESSSESETEEIHENLMVSKYQHNNPIKEEPELLDESDINQEVFLQSMAFNPGLIRPEVPVQKSITTTIINIETIKSITYYILETQSSLLQYQVRVKRRYNDFKKLLKELRAKYPDLLIPSISIGKISKLNDREIDERKRTLQNILNIIAMQQDIINSAIIKNFLEEENQSEFELRRSRAEPDSLLTQFLFTGKRSLVQLQQWWNKQEIPEIAELDQQIHAIQQKRAQLQSMFDGYVKIIQKQQQIDQALLIQDQNQDLFRQENHLQGVTFNYSLQISYQNAEQQNFGYVTILQNMIDFCDYSVNYYQRLLDFLYEMTEKLTKVNQGSSIHKSIQNEVAKQVLSAKEQLCSRDGIYYKYMDKSFKCFQIKYAEIHRELHEYSIYK